MSLNWKKKPIMLTFAWKACGGVTTHYSDKSQIKRGDSVQKGIYLSALIWIQHNLEICETVRHDLSVPYKNKETGGSK